MALRARRRHRSLGALPWSFVGQVRLSSKSLLYICWKTPSLVILLSVRRKLDILGMLYDNWDI